MRLLLTFFLVSCGVVSSCSSFSKKPTGPTTGPLYPPGVYQHAVSFELLDPVKRTMDMNGIVTLKSNSSLGVVGLSAFNTTLFRIVDNGKYTEKNGAKDEEKNEIKIEVFEEMLVPLTPYLLKNFKLMKKILFVRRENLVPSFQDEDGDTVETWVSDYDEAGIPRTIRIEAKKYKIKIGVKEYELEKPAGSAL